MSNQNFVNENHPAKKMREVSLVRLLLLTLRRWRSMLAAGLILALLLAGMKVLREYKNRSVSNVAHEEYLAAMEIYTASVESYTNAIERFQTKIDAKQKYFNESLLMQVDPHNECVSTATMIGRTPGLESADAVKTDDKGSDNASIVNASNVVQAYTDFIESGISYDEIAREYGVPEQSIRELVVVTSDEFHFSSVFKVQARSMDSELSKKIIDHILEEIEANRDSFRGTLGSYEVALVNRSEEVAVDTDLLQQQTELQNSIATLQKNLQTSQTALKELIKPSEATGASIKDIIKHGIKYGVVGFAGGIFLMVLFFAIRILMKGRILSDDELNVSYGLRNLITFPADVRGKKKRFFIDRFVDRLVSDAPDMSTSAAYDVLAARAENLAAAEGMKTVLLTGTPGQARLTSFAANLNKHAEKENSPVSYEAASDLDKNAAAIRRLRQADGCIIVEEVGESSFRDAAEVVEMVQASGKPILGTVYL